MWDLTVYAVLLAGGFAAGAAVGRDLGARENRRLRRQCNEVARNFVGAVNDLRRVAGERDAARDLNRGLAARCLEQGELLSKKAEVTR